MKPSKDRLLQGKELEEEEEHSSSMI
jgi:hypothetical protein